jgi:hypothetical protein
MTRMDQPTQPVEPGVRPPQPPPSDVAPLTAPSDAAPPPPTPPPAGPYPSAASPVPWAAPAEPVGPAPGLRYIWILIDKRRRGWHDLIAGTVVVQPE